MIWLVRADAIRYISAGATNQFIYYDELVSAKINLVVHVLIFLNSGGQKHSMSSTLASVRWRVLVLIKVGHYHLA